MSENIQENIKNKILMSCWKFLSNKPIDDFAQDMMELMYKIKDTIVQEYKDLTVIKFEKTSDNPLKFQIEILFPPQLDKITISDFGTIEPF